MGIADLGHGDGTRVGVDENGALEPRVHLARPERHGIAIEQNGVELAFERLDLADRVLVQIELVGIRGEDRVHDLDVRAAELFAQLGVERLQPFGGRHGIEVVRQFVLVAEAAGTLVRVVVDKRPIYREDDALLVDGPLERCSHKNPFLV